MTQSRKSWRHAFVRVSSSLCAAAAVLASPAPLVAATLPAGFTEISYASGLSSPTAMQFAPDGRLFIAQQTGALRVVVNGVLQPTPFVSLSVDSQGERGLLGVAFDPNFAANQYVYVYYTVPASAGGPRNRVSRFTANGNVAVPGSEVVIVELDPLSGATNHNGGAIDFGADGKLYIAIGDNANSATAQSMTSRHGKMLRLNADGSIPTDNPFYGTATGANRAIWSLGLRNPFTFALNRGGAGPVLMINDVGQSAFEEVNPGAPGANHGWPTTEGDFNPATYPAFTRPRYAYANDSSTCAITGGAFYPPASTNFPAQYQNVYFFADFCGGWIRYIDPTQTPSYPTLPQATTFATGVNGPVDLKVGPDGALYYLARGSAAVFRVTYGTSTPPTAPTLTTAVNGASVRLSWNRVSGGRSYRLEAGSATGLTNLANVDLGDVTSYETVVPAGTYFVRVRTVGAAGNSAPSNEARLAITTGAACTTAPPVPQGVVGRTGGVVASLAWLPSFAATGYVLDVGAATGVTSTSVPIGNVTAFQATAPPGTHYTRVRAVNACGSSAPSAEVVLVAACSPTAVVPGGFTVSKVGGVATITWQAALGATSYRLQAGTAPGLTNVLDSDVGTTTGLSVPLGGVPAGTYYVRVAALSACGLGAPSTEVALTVP